MYPRKQAFRPRKRHIFEKKEVETSRLSKNCGRLFAYGATAAELSYDGKGKPILPKSGIFVTEMRGFTIGGGDWRWQIGDLSAPDVRSVRCENHRLRR